MIFICESFATRRLRYFRDRYFHCRDHVVQSSTVTAWIRKYSLSSLCFAASFIVISLAAAEGRIAVAEKLKDGVAFEATELTGEGDLPPTFVEGPSPPMPSGSLGLQPTIVCRLHIDTFW